MPILRSIRVNTTLVAALFAASSGSVLTTLAEAQSAPPATPEADDAAPAPDPAANTAASSTAPVETPPVVVVQTGAPQPPSQNLASPLPAAPPPSPSTAVIKVGGGMILLYSNNYAPAYDAAGNKKKHLIDVWRASIVLDAKLDRFGFHYEFRARDRPLRWMPVNSWIEELYGSADLLAPTDDFGPLVLKVGKTYAQFGRFWDNSFYGNIHLRDGLKLVPNWGLSFEGTVGNGKPLAMKYYAQYFVIDGNTSTSNANRDTNSIVGTGTTPIGARRRDDFVLRVEPSWTLSPVTNIKVGASFEYFTADFPDTTSPQAMAAMSRVKDQDNTEKVIRYAVDFTAQLAWFGLWGEYTRQLGRHTNAFPYPPLAATMTTPGRAGAASPDVTYWLVGANFTIDRLTLQYNFNHATYEKVLLVGSSTPDAFGTHREWIHNPSFSVKISDQLRLIVEFPFWLRKPVPGLPTMDPKKPPLSPGETEVIEQQVLATLHGKF